MSQDVAFKPHCWLYLLSPQILGTAFSLGLRFIMHGTAGEGKRTQHRTEQEISAEALHAERMLALSVTLNQPSKTYISSRFLYALRPGSRYSVCMAGFM